MTDIMFRKRDGPMVYSQFLCCNLLVSCFLSESLCDVTSFSLKSGSESLSGESVSLICTLDRYTGEIFIFKSANKTDVVSSLSKCDQTRCRNLTPNYNFMITGNTVEITIKSLQRAKDQKWWTCRTVVSQNQKSEKQFQLTVYTVPSSITLEGPTKPCDLGQSRCEYTCTTDQCTYPAPIFTWLYVSDDNTTAYITDTTSVSNKSASCADETTIYEDTLIFPRFQLFSGNRQKTVSLQCYITFTGLSSGKRISGVSKEVIFAVKVSAVQVFDGETGLTNNTFIVNDKEEKLLNCIPGYGNPVPTVQWFRENTSVSTASEFRFIPANSDHGQQIYCVADNIPNNGIYDAVSIKVLLYVQVKIQFVYIEPAADTVLSVIEDTPEPVLCTASAGRPRATIKWYKNNVLLGEGNSTDFEMTDNNLELAKSTRYVKILRPDSRWTLSCEASNYDASPQIRANNSKSLNVLYPPEHMSLLFTGKPIPGPVVDVIKGTPGTLKCAAASNPPASLFSWNINQKAGDTLTIDDNIQNGQIVNCTARNIMTTTAGITINGYGSISKTINVQYGAIIERIEVNGYTGIVEIMENDPLIITCYVDSNPGSTISLFHGTNRLTELEQSLILNYSLSSAQCSHTNQYACNAYNGIPNVEQPAVETVLVNIKCSPRLAFETDPSVFAHQNTTTILSLIVLAYPIPSKYKWYRNTSNNWKELINTQNTKMTNATLETALAQFNLIIVHVESEDYGEYKLTVDNSIGAPLSYTFVLKSHGVSANAVDDKIDKLTLAIVAGVMGSVLAMVIVVLVIMGLIIWRNHTGVTSRKQDMLTYEMPNCAAQGSEERTYDTVNQNINEYETSGS